MTRSPGGAKRNPGLSLRQNGDKNVAACRVSRTAPVPLRSPGYGDNTTIYGATVMRHFTEQLR